MLSIHFPSLSSSLAFLCILHPQYSRPSHAPICLASPLWYTTGVPSSCSRLCSSIQLSLFTHRPCRTPRGFVLLLQRDLVARVLMMTINRGCRRRSLRHCRPPSHSRASIPSASLIRKLRLTSYAFAFLIEIQRTRRMLTYFGSGRDTWRAPQQPASDRSYDLHPSHLASAR